MLDDDDDSRVVVVTVLRRAAVGPDDENPATWCQMMHRRLIVLAQGDTILVLVSTTPNKVDARGGQEGQQVEGPRCSGLFGDK